MKEFFLVWSLWMGFMPSIATPAQLHPENAQLAYVAK
jgi:hypothetical protein